MLERERVARLGFVDAEDQPRVLPVTFAVADDAIWSAIDDKPKRAGEPARVRYLRERPRAALCVDHYEDDWSRLAWVQLLGRIEVVPIHEGRTGLAALSAKYHVYGERTPPGPLLCLRPERVLHWRAVEAE
jgi:PPOX class probable F420-dependent enzyme